MATRTRKVIAAQHTPAQPVAVQQVVAPQHPLLGIPNATPTPAAPQKTKLQRTKAANYAPAVWGQDWVIGNLVANPKNGLPASRFALHHNGQTVAQYIAAVVALGPNCISQGQQGIGCAKVAAADLQWGVQHGFFTITAPAVAVQQENA